ncbi:MAG TPA: hypothetical protein VGM31_13910, partial [Puia sp.]
MNFINAYVSAHVPSRCIAQTLLRMKFTAIFLLAFGLQVFSKGYTQKVTLSLKKAPVTRVFKEIFRQTGISIIYNVQLFDGMAPVTIQVKDA